MTQHKRTALLAAGQVQGVGFRPFIYRLAVEGGLSGSVGNTSEGVRIEVQGDPAQVDAFAVRLRRELPPLARLTRLEVTELPPVDGETEFVIVASHGHAGHSVLVSPDVGICEDCLRDMRTPGDPRFGYAFTNCTNCGPRYTITRSIPYDRATTSMACFPFCPRCEAEYRDPLDRRFHAQPVACPQCGPRLWTTPCCRRAAPCPRTAPRRTGPARRPCRRQRPCGMPWRGRPSCCGTAVCWPSRAWAVSSWPVTPAPPAAWPCCACASGARTNRWP